MKILAASLDGAGHCYPMLAVARALVRRGHDVTLMSGSKHEADAARAGCSFTLMPMVFGSSFERLRPYQDSELLARACAWAVEQVAPDVVVADLLTFGPALAAEVAGVPWASLVIHGLHTWSADLLPFGIGRAPNRGVGRLGDLLIRRFHRRDVERARDAANAVRLRLGLDPVDRIDPQLSGELILVATLPSLELPRSDWPARAHVIGPCLWDDLDGTVPPPLPAGDAPLVLVAASTAHDAGAFVKASIDAVVRAGARAVVTLGKSPRPAVLPDGVVAVPSASHDTLLRHCSAVVCNGGHGIVARALTHGVPVVVMPGHGDQRENGYRVERAGAGLRVMRAEQIPAALCAVLTEGRFREAAAGIATEAAGMDGPARAAELVEALGAHTTRHANDATP